MSHDDDIVQRAASRLVRQAVENVDAPGRLARLHRARRRERIFVIAAAPVVAMLLIGLPLLLLRGGDPPSTDQATTTTMDPSATAVACPGPAPLPDWAFGSAPLEGVHGSVVALVDAMNRLPSVVAIQTDFTGEWIEKPPSDAVVREAFAAVGATGEHTISLAGDPEYVRLWPQRTVWLSDLYSLVNSNLANDFLGELTDVHSREEALAYLSEEGHDPSRCEAVAAIVSRTDAVFAGTLEDGGPPAETDSSTDLPPFVLTASWTLDIDGSVDDLAVWDGRLWAVTQTGAIRIDPSIGEIDATVELDSTCGYANIEPGEGAIWVAHGNRLSRIDPENAEVVASADVGVWEHDCSGTRPLAVGEGAAWVAMETGVGRFNPGDLRLTDEIEVGAAPSGIVLGSDSLWVLVGQEVLRIDPTTFETVARVTVPGSVFYPSIGTPLAYGNDAVWIGAGGLARLDPATNEIEPVYVVSDEVCCGPLAIGFAAGNVIGSDMGKMSVVDPGTGTLERIAVTQCGVFSIAGTDDGFWAAVSRCGPTIQRYDLDRE